MGSFLTQADTHYHPHPSPSLPSSLPSPCCVLPPTISWDLLTGLPSCLAHPSWHFLPSVFRHGHGEQELGREEKNKDQEQTDRQNRWRWAGTGTFVTFYALCVSPPLPLPGWPSPSMPFLPFLPSSLLPPRQTDSLWDRFDFSDGFRQGSHSQTCSVVPFPMQLSLLKTAPAAHYLQQQA